jgi:peptidoglycan biosynthesis protein MviN/MurJ (putative lipid II flippase)
MTSTTAAVIAFLGLILTMLGVGGVEHSVTTIELLQALAVSVLGLALMATATAALNHSEYYDQGQQ